MCNGGGCPADVDSVEIVSLGGSLGRSLAVLLHGRSLAVRVAVSLRLGLGLHLHLNLGLVTP